MIYPYSWYLWFIGPKHVLTCRLIRSGDKKSGALGVLFCGGFAQRPFWSRTGKVHQTAVWRGSMGTNKHRKLSSMSGTGLKPMNEGVVCWVRAAAWS